MDLYTASGRLARSFAVDGQPLPIGHHGIVGDGFNCALIGVDGSIAWHCLPRFRVLQGMAAPAPHPARRSCRSCR